MKTELRLKPHSEIAGANVVEVWHDGQLIATVTGEDDRPGVRVISKHKLSCGYVIGMTVYVAAVSIFPGEQT